MGPFRQSDAVLTVAQDNSRQSIEVTAANEVALKITGYPAEELKGKPFQEIVSDKVAEMLTDYVEFETGANDVGDVLRKVRDFQLKNNVGKAIPFKLRIVRHNSQTHDEFLLIMHNEETQREIDTLLAMLRSNFEGHAALNPDTGLPDRDSFIKGIELARLQLDKLAKGVSLAVIELDAYETLLSKYGVQACQLVMQDVAKLCAQNLRSNDVVAQLAKNRLAILLIGATKEPAQMVLNRLRWLIASHSSHTPQGTILQTSVSILFHELASDDEPQKLIEQMETFCSEKSSDSINMVAYL